MKLCSQTDKAVPVQYNPSFDNVKPGLHRHSNPPLVFTHRPFLQTPGWLHSSMSLREMEFLCIKKTNSLKILISLC